MTTKKTTKSGKKKERTPTSAVEDMYTMLKRHPRFTILMVGFALGWIAHTLLS